MKHLLLPFLLLACKSIAAPRTVHVIVALCDNAHQGIVKVPAGIGNGQETSNNLYWGAGYGMRTHFDRAPEWERVKVPKPDVPHILERVVWRHRDSAVFLVADAYDGRHILEATEDLLHYASGAARTSVTVDGLAIPAGGGADLVVYVGHNGLMDVAVTGTFPTRDRKPRETIILACMSRSWYRDHLRATGAQPLLWTTGLMAPEAYTLRDALAGWVLREDAEAIRERAAQAYHRYQKCGINGARRLLVTGW